MSDNNLVHKFIPMPQAMKIPDAKADVDKEWKKLETIPARDLEKVKSKKGVLLEAQRDKNKVHMPLEGLEPINAQMQRESRAPGGTL